MQATHAPPLQTLSAPHDVPFGAFPVSMQTGVPVLHAVVPVRHGLPATAQICPATQATHSPAPLHTLSCPHAPPGGTFMPVSTHVGAAPAQSRRPV